jgi:serine/threonine protein kinase
MMVAVKLLKKKYIANDCDPEYASAFAALDAEAAEEFEKETATLRSIKHPSLLIFFGAGTADDGRLFMATEYLRLGALRGVLLDHSRKVDWDTRNRIALQVASGCAHLHSLSIVHRDLKVIHPPPPQHTHIHTCCLEFARQCRPIEWLRVSTQAEHCILSLCGICENLTRVHTLT